jgi:hypothetical protein
MIPCALSRRRMTQHLIVCRRAPTAGIALAERRASRNSGRVHGNPWHCGRSVRCFAKSLRVKSSICYPIALKKK